jgi:hypothetical protein
VWARLRSALKKRKNCCAEEEETAKTPVDLELGSQGQVDHGPGGETGQTGQREQSASRLTSKMTMPRPTRAPTQAPAQIAVAHLLAQGCS